ncbi:MAG TPA: IS66 family transposase [Draconibacterium sp.]|nr:IS66 family transposase [Draconibacterium sp.]
MDVIFWFLASCTITFGRVIDRDITIQILFCQLEELNKRVNQLAKENKFLRDGNALLKIENAELKARLNSDSHNSNKPPSSDGYKKNTVKPAFPKGKNSSHGGQKGHEGKTLRQVEAPDKIEFCTPGICSCGHGFTEKELVLAEKRQIFELPLPKLEITEYQIFKALCPVCGQEQRGTTPQGVNAPVQYGNNAKALAALLNVHYRLPYKKIHGLFNDLFGYPINESTINQAGEKCYANLEESEQIIKSKIVGQKVAHADETGIRIARKLQWLHTATSVLYTYLFVHEKRGTGAIQSNKSILVNYFGWLVHDCWGSYFKLKQLNHAICGAHILRELESLIENQQSKWAKVFKLFLLSVYNMPFEERVKRKELIESRYDHICILGEKAEPLPIKMSGRKGRSKRTSGRNLVERLISKREYWHLLSTRKCHLQITLQRRISGRQRSNKKYQTAFVLSRGPKYMQGLKDLYLLPEKTSAMSFQNYVLLLKDTIL